MLCEGYKMKNYRLEKLCRRLLKISKTIDLKGKSLFISASIFKFSSESYYDIFISKNVTLGILKKQVYQLETLLSDLNSFI
jgi:hypothetical protein